MAKLPTYHEVLASIGNAEFTSADYLTLIDREASLPFDFILHLFRLLHPQFEVREDKLLIPAVGAVERFQHLRREGKSAAESQYWANLLLVTGFVGAASSEEAKKLADSIAHCWRDAVKRCDLSVAQEVKVLEDRQDDEIYVVLADWPEHLAD